MSNEISPDLTLQSLRSNASECERNATGGEKEILTQSVIEAWASLPDSVRSALVSSELSKKEGSSSSVTASLSHSYSSPSFDTISDKSSMPSDSTMWCSTGDLTEIVEEDTCTKLVMKPLLRAPKNVFAFEKTHTEEFTDVKKVGSKTVTTNTKVVSTGRGWRNIFTLPISYDVNLVPDGSLLDPTNSQLLEATGVHPEGYNRRFAAIDDQVDKIYGERIREYFAIRGIELTTSILAGGEAEKRMEAVDKLLDDLCSYKLRRREPFLAIGGGVLLDIAGMGACMYRRGVPFVRVPTTLLAIVDASVGVKNGVDYCCGITDETYKNRVGSFYAPSSCLLDSSFISTQDERNVANGFGEIIKLALVRSSDLFDLLESHGSALIASLFQPTKTVPQGVSARIVELSIQIMLEELGPNLWESKLDRCVDYGHTFSKILEMLPGADIMHGEAVNVDGFFCVILSHLRGLLDMTTVERIFKCMKSLSLPTYSKDLNSDTAWQSCKDAVEHRHGEQRIPLITEIGKSICVSDITPEELNRALDMMDQFEHE